MTDSYEVVVSVSLKKSHVSYHVVFITACRVLKNQNVRLQQERKRVDADVSRQ